MTNKIYNISWTEYHQTFVRAKNKTKAEEAVSYETSWLTDDNVEVNNFKAQKLTKKESESLTEELGF